jgi:hypothetical protein
MLTVSASDRNGHCRMVLTMPERIRTICGLLAILILDHRSETTNFSISAFGSWQSSSLSTPLYGRRLHWRYPNNFYCSAATAATASSSSAENPSAECGSVWNGSKKQKTTSTMTNGGNLDNMDKSDPDPDRNGSRRWMGSYKRGRRRLSDIPQKQKTKFQVKVNGRCLTLYKQRMESIQHVLTKAVIYKLFIDEVQEDKGNQSNEEERVESNDSSKNTNSDDYNNNGNNNRFSDIRFEIEFPIGDPNYLPDVVGFQPIIPPASSTGSCEPGIPQQQQQHSDNVIFWGESGRMKPHKALDLMLRYDRARIIHCRWGIGIDTFADPFVEYLQEMVDTGIVDYPIKSWWNGRFSFATLPTNDLWRFVDEESNTVMVTKSDLEWRELDVDLIVSPSPTKMENVIADDRTYQ